MQSHLEVYVINCAENKLTICLNPNGLVILYPINII